LHYWNPGLEEFLAQNRSTERGLGQNGLVGLLGSRDQGPAVVCHGVVIMRHVVILAFDVLVLADPSLARARNPKDDVNLLH
jgi:hypothetical protein